MINKQNERKSYLDVLRIIAIFAVVMIHVSANYVTNYNTIVDFTIGNIFDSISRLGVPLFLMISGALILDENKKFDCKKRILSLLIPMLVWSFFYALIYSVILPIKQNESINIYNFLSSFIKGHFHLWYMWAIIGLYLITPILRIFVKKENKNIVAYFIVLSLLFQFTQPIIKLLFNEIDIINKASHVYTYVFEKLNLNFLGGLTSYFLAGWFLANTNYSKKQNTIIYIIGTISLISIILLTQAFPDQYDLTYSNSGILVFFYSYSIFVLVKTICLEQKTSKFFIKLSKLSFGVYLIHVIILDILNQIIPKNSFYIPVIFLSTIVISFIISYIVSKIPIIRKTIKS